MFTTLFLHLLFVKKNALCGPDPGFRFGTAHRWWNDRLCRHTVVPSSRDHAQLDALQHDRCVHRFATIFYTYKSHLMCTLSCIFPPLNQIVDIWSVGCIMAELLTGRTLFPGTDRILSPLLGFELFCTDRAGKGRFWLLSCLYGVASLCIRWSETQFTHFKLTRITVCELESRRAVCVCVRIPLWCMIQSCPLLLQDAVHLPVSLPQRVIVWWQNKTYQNADAF